MTDWNEIFHSHKREWEEPKSIEFERFTVDGKPTCSAWSGRGGYPKMTCKFFCTFHFGQRLECVYSGNEIIDCKPDTDCPLWGGE